MNRTNRKFSLYVGGIDEWEIMRLEILLVFFSRVKLSESDSEIVVKKFTHNSPPNELVDSSPSSMMRMMRRSNIAIRIPPIDSDLQTLIKSIDGTRRQTSDAELSGNRDARTTKDDPNHTHVMESGDEKDVVIKLYKPKMAGSQQRRRSSSSGSGSIESIHGVRVRCSLNNIVTFIRLLVNHLFFSFSFSVYRNYRSPNCVESDAKKL